VFITARDPATRTQLRAVAWGSGIGMLYNVAMVLLPASAIDPDTNSLLDSGAMLMALATPLAYVYAMVRYDLLIDGWIWRRWLVRVVVSGMLVFGWFAGVLLLGGAPALADRFLAGGWPVAISAIVLVITIEQVHTRLDAWLFHDQDYAQLLDEATRALHRFHDWAAYGRFFTADLPAWLNLRGALLLVAPAGDGACLQIVASSPGLAERVRLDVGLQPDGEVGIRLRDAGGPVPLATLLTLDPSTYSAPDRALLVDFQAAGVELLLPLVSSQQPTLLGVVALAGKESDDPFSRQERAALAALTRAAATAAETVALFEIQQRHLAALEQERAYRSALARETNILQERVRRHIARDLHDTPLQELGVLVRALSNLREDVQALQIACQDQILAQSGSTETRPAEILALLDAWDRQFGRLVGEDVEELPAAPATPDGPDPAPVLVESRPTIEGLMVQAQAAAAHIREICNDLHPTYLQNPLGRTLQDSMARVAGQYSHIVVSFTVYGDEPGKLPDEVKIACKQVLEQALRNACDHSIPSQVTATLRFNPGSVVTLEIADDGRGFTPPPVHAWRTQGHHGLANMRERADLVGGALRVQSHPGQGTRISLTIPLADPVAWHNLPHLDYGAGPPS
jgi:signal transduction histidine kinase